MQPYRFLVVAWFAFIKYVGFTKSFFQVTDEASLSLRSSSLSGFGLVYLERKIKPLQ